MAHETPYLTLDPQERNDSVTWSVLGNIYEPLVEFDRNMKIAGRLAERWENPNDLTWRFYLRKNVRFHNGKPFTAEDVLFTIQRALANNRVGTKPYLISVKESRVIDANTIDIVTDRPNPVLLNRLTFLFILPSSQLSDGIIETPVGTGPYVFEKQETPGRKLILRSNNDYWGGKPSIQRVQFVAFDDENEPVNQLLKGTVQVARDYPFRMIPRVEESKNCMEVAHDGLGVALLGFNLTGDKKTNPFVDIELRRVMQLATNGSRLVQEALQGRANVAQQLVSPVIFGFDPSLVSVTPDIDQAKKLLAGLGFSKSFKTEIYGTDDQRLYKLAEQMRGLNVDVQPRLLEWSQLYDKLLKHEVPMYTLSWNCSTGDASDFLDSCIHSPDPKTGYGNFNVAGYSNPEVDKLIELSGQTLKTNERKLYLQQALAIVSKDIPYIPLYSPYRHYGVNREVQWQPRRDGRVYAFDMNWKQAQ